MDSIKKLEKNIETWLKPVPHLPADWRKWLGQNVWWLVLIGTILSAIAVLMAIGGIFTTAALINGTVGIFGKYYSSSVYSGNWMMISIVSILLSIATIVMSAIAINPLKEQKKHGWDLLFLSLLIGVASIVISTVLNFSVLTFIPSLLVAAISAAIGSYILFEIRSQFSDISLAKKSK